MRPQAILSLTRFLQFSLILSWLLHASPVEAHRVSSVSLISYLDTKQGTYVLDAAMEVVPSEEQALNDQISPEDAARQFAEEYLVVMFDRKDQKPAMDIRIEDASDSDTPQELRRQQVLTKMSGKIPAGAAEFLLYLDPSCPMAVVMVVVKDNQPSRRMQVVLAGEYSRPISVAPVEEGDPFSAEGAVSPSQTEPVKADAATETTPAAKAGPGAIHSGWRAFLREGLMPGFLLVGVLLLTLEKRSVLLQVATLLLAISVTVTVVASRHISLPDWSPIAFKVLFVGIVAESLFHDRIRWWRLPLVAIAGVIAGFEIAWTASFRGLFGSPGFGTGEVIRFLLGVELAFVLVGLLAALLLKALSRFECYRRAVVHPLAVLLISYGVYGVVELYL